MWISLFGRREVLVFQFRLLSTLRLGSFFSNSCLLMLALVFVLIDYANTPCAMRNWLCLETSDLWAANIGPDQSSSVLILLFGTLFFLVIVRFWGGFAYLY